MKKCAAYFLILAIPLVISLNADFALAAEEVSFMMCANGVVNIMDMDYTVRDVCGEPDSKSEDQWVYNFGPTKPVYTVIFKKGLVERILKDAGGN